MASKAGSYEVGQLVAQELKNDVWCNPELFNYNQAVIEPVRAVDDGHRLIVSEMKELVAAITWHAVAEMFAPLIQELDRAHSEDVEEVRDRCH